MDFQSYPEQFYDILCTWMDEESISEDECDRRSSVYLLIQCCETGLSDDRMKVYVDRIMRAEKQGKAIKMMNTFFGPRYFSVEKIQALKAAADQPAPIASQASASTTSTLVHGKRKLDTSADEVNSDESSIAEIYKGHLPMNLSAPTA